MQKISKSKTPKYQFTSAKGEHLELEPLADRFLLSVRDEDNETWQCVELSSVQIEEMLVFVKGNS